LVPKTVPYKVAKVWKAKAKELAKGQTTIRLKDDDDEVDSEMDAGTPMED
jgi:hypothetical protein